MLIGVDASRAFVSDKTGTENYSYELLTAMLKLPEAEEHSWRLYVKEIPKGSVLKGRTFLELIPIQWPRLWTQGGLAWECLKRPPDVLWVPAHTLPVIRRRKMKTVVTIHGIEYEYLPEFNRFPQSLYLNKSTEYAVKWADKLIAVSKSTKKQLVERLGADEKKIEVVYEGIGEIFTTEGSELARGVRNQVRRKYQLPKDYILFVGTIQPRKNLVRLVEGFSRIEKSDPKRSGLTTKGSERYKSSEPTNLIIAGKEGWMSEEIYKAPKKYGVEDKVQFIGRVDDEDLPVVYKMAKLFVWPSLMEGFGLPILEAMQMGVPVIASNRGALPEVGGKAMIQVDPERVEEIAKAIKSVLEDKVLRESLIARGNRQVKKFSYQKAAQKTLKILTEW
jgi:glycosyltransferase involved in cell wall biosynthesis